MPDSNDEPIFTRLARERGYETLIGDGPYIESMTAKQTLKGIRNAAENVSRAMSRVEPTRPYIKATVTLKEMLDENFDLQAFISDQTKRFSREFPSVEMINVQRVNELDGTITIIVSEEVPPSLETETENSQPPEPIEVKPLFEKAEVEPFMQLDVVGFLTKGVTAFREQHPNSIITSMEPKMKDDGSFAVEIEAIEPVSAIAHEDLEKVRAGEMTVEELKNKLAAQRKPHYRVPNAGSKEGTHCSCGVVWPCTYGVQAAENLTEEEMYAREFPIWGKKEND